MPKTLRCASQLLLLTLFLAATIPGPSANAAEGAASNSVRQAGDAWTEPTTKIRFRYIPPATFMMGDIPQEGRRPGSRIHRIQHRVTLTRGFWMAETELTQAQWLLVMKKNPSKFAACGKSCPVDDISWFDSITVANFLSKHAGRTPCYRTTGGYMHYGLATGLRYETVEWVEGCNGFRLPTEAEWEHAARTGSSRVDPETGEFPDVPKHMELADIAWYAANSRVRYEGGMKCVSSDSFDDEQYQHPEDARCGTHPVATKKANAWGLYDMLGNVYEWVWDQNHYYPWDPQVDPRGADQGNRSLRGFAWMSRPDNVRPWTRMSFQPGYGGEETGLRLVIDE